jgi:hypothetical protein
MTKKKVAPVSDKKEPAEKKVQAPKPPAEPIVEFNKAWRVAHGIQEK